MEARDIDETIARTTIDMLRPFDADPLPTWEKLRPDQREEALQYSIKFRAALAEAGLVVVGNWKPIKSAPRDGSWFLLRGRNSADRPMVPVVVSWRHGEGSRDAAIAFRDSGTLRDCSFLLSGENADWRPLEAALPQLEGQKK